MANRIPLGQVPHLPTLFLIRKWAQGKIPPSYMSKEQLQILKEFIKKDINWAELGA